MEALRVAFTTPGFRNLFVIVVGWLCTTGVHAVTEALVVTGVAERRHHETFHRFFSRGAWIPDEVGFAAFRLIRALLDEAAPIRAVIDDTVASKKGPKVFGLGSHVDPVRSTKKHKAFTFGHCWVVLAVLVPVPFSRRTFALPVLLRLYRNKKECNRAGAPYRKKTELARELLQILVQWAGTLRIELAMDAAYCNDTVLDDLPSTVTVFGSMRPDAVVTAPPPRRRKGQRGRPPVRGETLPKPQALASDDTVPWSRTTATLYGERQTVWYKTFCAQWYRACGGRLLRIVVVRVDSGKIPLRVFFSTDPHLCVRYLLEAYAGRWNIEVTFRELKQLLGFADSSARLRKAVERVAPLVAFMYSLLVVWFARGVYAQPVAAPPNRPWYTHKRGFSFADILRAARRVLADANVLDPGCNFNNLRKIPQPRRVPSATARRRAA